MHTQCLIRVCSTRAAQSAGSMPALCAAFPCILHKLVCSESAPICRQAAVLSAGLLAPCCACCSGLWWVAQVPSTVPERATGGPVVVLSIQTVGFWAASSYLVLVNVTRQCAAGAPALLSHTNICVHVTLYHQVSMPLEVPQTPASDREPA